MTESLETIRDFIYFVFRRKWKHATWLLATALIFYSIEDIPIPDCNFEKGCETPPTKKTYAFILACILYLIVIVRYSLKLPSLYKKSKQLSYENQVIWETEMKVFSANLELTSNDRITLYHYNLKSGLFFKAGRFSPNPSFNSFGRATYKNGLILDAFNTGENGIIEIVTSDPDTDLKAYIKEVNEKSNIKKSVIKAFSMKSRILYAHQIQRLDGTASGVLLIESIKENFSHIKHNGAPLNEDRLNSIFEREHTRLSHYMSAFKEPVDLFDFEESEIL